MHGLILAGGETAITVFTCIMDSSFYQKILQTNLLTFVKKKFPDGYRLFQDNDPKHASNSTKKSMEENANTTRKSCKLA